MSPRSLHVAALLVLAVGLAPARADVVRLTSGGVIRGEVVSETRAEVVVRTASGTAVIPRREVEAVEREPVGSADALEAEYRARLRSIDARDPEARYALGLWLKARGALSLARREFEAALRLDPTHRFAREELQAGAARGRAAPGATAGSSLASRPEVTRALEALRAGDDVDAAWVALDALDPEERLALAAALRDVARELRRAHERAARRARELTGRYDPAVGADALRARALARWELARDEALAAIFDDASAGPAVAERVARARAAWLALDALQRRDLQGLLALGEDEAQALRADLLGARRRLEALAAACAARGLDVDASPAAATDVIEALLAERAGVAAGELTGWDAALARRLADERVLARSVEALRACDPALRPTADELEQVRLTNEHRMALGRRALALDLAAAAALRARDQAGVLGSADPSADAAPAAGGAGGEVTAEGVESARAAHELWTGSAAHHRTLLDPAWRTIAARRDGARWTQRFGADQPPSVATR